MRNLVTPRRVLTGAGIWMILHWLMQTLFAASATINGVTVSSTVPSVATASTDRDNNSSARGTKDTIVFDKLDSTDMGGGSTTLEYAPYRSESGKNWHLLRLFGNGSSTTLTASVSGTYNGIALDTILKVFCGGFFPNAGGGAMGGTPSTDWERLSTFTRTVGPFDGIASMNYQLNVTGIPAASYPGGTVTFSLVST